MWHKEEPKIEFISRVKGLTEQEGIQPVKASLILPDWWKTVPVNPHVPGSNLWPDANHVGECPAFPDLFSSGYIIPMWADTTLYFKAETREYRWKCGNAASPFEISIFRPNQFTDYVPYTFQGSQINAVWQFINPWEVRTPKGYSLFQLPLFYHFNSEFSVLPGTYDGYNVEANKLEVATFKDDQEIFIKKGTPLVQFVPYKKIKVDSVVREKTPEDDERNHKKWLDRQLSFRSWYGKNRNKGTLD